MKKVGILLSGGMDSYALAYLERPDIAVTIDYGQRAAKAEIMASQRLSERLSIQHEIINVDLTAIGSGDMHGSMALECAPASDWWPYRNQMLITLAAMKLIQMDVGRLLIATVATDSIHRDGSIEFVRKVDELLSMQEAGMHVEAPAIHLPTDKLIQQSGIPYSILAWAHSCHTGNLACGQCRGCVKHRQIVAKLGYAEA